MEMCQCYAESLCVLVQVAVVESEGWAKHKMRVA
jgi:hypothetical protein